MPAPANVNRRADLETALKRAKPKDLLRLEDLADVWGVHKSRFISVKQKILGMPTPVTQGTTHLYPAREALRAMLDYEKRHDGAERKRQETTNAILGGLRKQRDDAAVAGGMSARDLQILNRMATEIEEREREQRAYIAAAEVSRVAGDVFSEISEFMAVLDNRVDPNGLLPPPVRALISSLGSEALLGLHKRMKVLLNADVVAGDPGTAPDSARKPRTRRKRR